MSVTLFRTGLWSLLAIFVAYVLTETMSDSPLAQILNHSILLLLTEIALGFIVLGLIARMIENARSLRGNHCKVCGVRIPPKAIYCRAHLNEMLEEEDLRHRTMNTRLPD